jgi:hypothetical protein
MLIQGYALATLGVKVVVDVLWTYALSWICRKGFSTLSWFLVLLPYIVLSLTALKIYELSPQHRQFLRSIHLQGPMGREFFGTGAASTKKHPVKPASPHK